MKLNIDLLDIKESDIEAIEDLAEKIERFPKDLASESADKVGYSNMTVSFGEGENRVSAIGDQVMFQEYGTGFVAPVDVITDVETGEEVLVGQDSWSSEHARTIEKWIASGKDPMLYPHNQEPQYKMTDEIQRLGAETEARAKEYFK